MGKRVASAAVLWGVVAAVLWFFRTGGAVALVAIVAALTLRELYQLLAATGGTPFVRSGMFFGALIAAAPWLQARCGLPAHALLPLATVILAVRTLGEREPAKRLGALTSTVFGLVYVALLLQYLVRVATPLPGDTVAPAGRLLLCLWIVCVAKFCDSGALLAGLAFGRRLLAPAISPKKTWEGAAGGVALAVLVGAAFAWLAGGNLPLSPGRAALLALPVAAAAIVSDLVESVIKRHAEIKDSGRSIPGIGGIFDMSDSLLLAAPIGYFLFDYFVFGAR